MTAAVKLSAFALGHLPIDQQAAVESAIERARVVGALDAWAGRYARAIWQIEINADGAECVGRVDEGVRGVRQYFRKTAHTVDAARAAAAKAIEAGEV